MKKVLLIYPSVWYASSWGEKYAIKAHMLELFSFLRCNGIEAEMLDLEMELGRPATDHERESFVTEAGRLISQLDFDIVGISCWSSLNYLSSLAVAKLCKQMRPESCIVVGGNHATALPSDFIYEESPFDFIVQGEGELALLNVCLRGEKKREHPEIVRGTPLGLMRDYPLDWKQYRYAIPNRVGSIYLSRGCSFPCSFCMEEYKRTCMANTVQSGWRAYPVDTAIARVQGMKPEKGKHKVAGVSLVRFVVALSSGRGQANPIFPFFA